MLFLLTLGVAVCLGVVMKRLRDRKAAVAAINAAGGTMGLTVTGPDWLRKLIDDEKCFYNPIRVSLGPIARQIGREEPKLDDASLARLGADLKSFRRLEVLDIRRSAVSDRSAGLLGELGGLKHLRLSNTQIGKATTRELRRLGQLESLLLDGTAITDECVDDLCEIRTLKNLDIQKTQITSDGVSRLRERLAGCKIEASAGAN